jgi:hypothetical protein
MAKKTKNDLAIPILINSYSPIYFVKKIVYCCSLAAALCSVGRYERAHVCEFVSVCVCVCVCNVAARQLGRQNHLQ